MPSRRSRLPLRFVLAVALAALTVAVHSAVAHAPVKHASPLPPWRNPVIAADFPDPSIVREGETYWATATSSAAAPGFPLLRSTDLVHWTPAGTIFRRLPGWASDSFWAPEIFADDAGVRVYYSARRRGGRLCVAVATAPAIAGPYTDRGPLVCQPAGSIDPTRARDRDGRLFLVWKEDGNAVGRRSTIWRQPLTPDGLRLAGRPAAMLRSRDRWEGDVVEAPSVVERDGWTYLFYSGNTYGSPGCRYALGVARARTLEGPFVRHPANPILRSSRGWRCPGHATFTTDDDGNAFVLYHAYPAAGPGQRYGLLSRVTWSADGWPVVAGGAAAAVRVAR